MKSKNTLRILMLDAHSRGGGQVNYVHCLADKLTSMGHEVTIGCRSGSVLVQVACDAGCAYLDDFYFAGGFKPGKWWHDIRRLMRYVDESKPDIVHVNGSQDHWAAGIANYWRGRSTCLIRTRHNTYKVKNSFSNRILNRFWTDYQIVVCDMVRKTLASQPIFDPERLCTIHNGVDANRFSPNTVTREQVRSSLGYRPEHILCGIVGRLVLAKGHTFLLQAVSTLRNTCPELRLLVIGEGTMREALEKEAHKLGIHDITQFSGFQSEMQNWVQAIDIGIQPSIDCDTSSFSLKELMAAEKPVIASDYGGLSEILDDGVEGYVVPASTVAPLAQALVNLIRHPELRSSMGRKGRQRVLREFTIEHFADATLVAYKHALEAHREPAAS